MFRIKPTPLSEKTVSLPASKSVSHRICILGGLNDGQTNIRNLLHSEDLTITVTALRQMGMEAVREDAMLICQSPLGQRREERVFLGNSGSSARFLLPLAAYLDAPVEFYGTPRLHERPFRELFAAMTKLGIRVEGQSDSLPARVYPGKIAGGRIAFENLPTSQIITSLMLAALWMQRDLTIELQENIPSLPYIRMTYKLMKRLGLEVEYQDNEIWVKAHRPDYIWNVTVEKDLSAASYWVVFGLINEIQLTLTEVTLPSLQGDERIFEIAERVGADLMLYPDRMEVSGRIRRGFSADCQDIPDLVPSLSVLGMFAPEPVRLYNVGHLRYKESDRIAAIQENIAALGGRSEYADGALEIFPQKSYRGGVVQTFNDHRIAMSFALAGTRIPDVIIDRPDCVGKSYPNFWKDFSYWEATG